MLNTATFAPMFTGIIQDVGTVREIRQNGDMRLVIAANLDLSKAPEGASIACCGVCLTVVEKGAAWFAVDVSAETLSKTTIAHWDVGTKINLEPALKMGDELGGHMVSGHVDGVGVLKSIQKDGASHCLRIAVPDSLKHFIAPKGSVALDGVSLTVNDVDGGILGVNIIPHTWAHTNLCDKKSGDILNIEVDMLARYIARMKECGI